jgi:hypothetical protein
LGIAAALEFVIAGSNNSSLLKNATIINTIACSYGTFLHWRYETLTLDSDLCLGSTMLTSLCGVLQERPAVLDQHGSSHLPHFGHGQLSRSALAEMENVINSSVIILPGFIEIHSC